MRERLGILAVVAVVGALAWWLWSSSGDSSEGAAATAPSSSPTRDGPRTPDRALNRTPSEELGSDLAAAHRADPSTAQREGLDGSIATQSAADSGNVNPNREAEVDAWMRGNATDAERAIERFCEDNDKLNESPLFPKNEGTRDAATYMAPRIDWEGGVRPPGMLHLSEPLALKIRAAGDDWPVKLIVADSEGLDFGWLKELAQFDTWGVAEYGPMRDDPSTNFFETPIPNYMSLVGWVKLRLARALALNDGAAASAEVRQLATLIQSNGLVIADAIAVHILKLEARARAVAVTRGLAVEQWPALDPDQALRFRRVALSAPYLFAPGVPGDVVKRARRCLANPCSALAEGLGMQLALAPYAKVQNGEAVEGAVRDAPCPRRVFDSVRRAKPIDPETIIKDFGGANRLQEFYGADAGR